MAFVDECTVFLTAGRGGNGSASLHSEPYKPRGGPDGGNGGDGGSIVFEVSSGVHDLSWLADHPHQRAPGGEPGRERQARGRLRQGPRDPGPRGHRRDGRSRTHRRSGGRGHARRRGRRRPRRPGQRGLRGTAQPRASHRRARRGRGGRARSRWSSVRWPTSAWWGCRTRASPRCWLVSPPPNPRSPTIPFTTLTPNLGVAGEDDGPVRGGRHPRPGGGRQRGQGAGAPVPSAHRAMPGARPGRRPGRRGSRRRPRDPRCRARAPTIPSWHDVRPSSWARRPTWSMTPPRRSRRWARRPSPSRR